MFRNFCGDYITKPLNTKEDIKNYIFDYIDREFPDIKTYAKLLPFITRPSREW